MFVHVGLGSLCIHVHACMYICKVAKAYTVVIVPNYTRWTMHAVTTFIFEIRYTLYFECFREIRFGKS